jgi:hypothetical protein
MAVELTGDGARILLFEHSELVREEIHSFVLRQRQFDPAHAWQQPVSAPRAGEHVAIAQQYRPLCHGTQDVFVRACVRVCMCVVRRARLGSTS